MLLSDSFFSRSFAHRAAATVDENWKNRDRNGMRFMIIVAAPNLVSTSQQSITRDCLNHVRNISTPIGFDELLSLFFGESLQLEVPGMVRRGYFSPLDDDEDSRSDEGDQVEWEEEEVLDQTGDGEPATR
jgi:hypothetical protein